jgi:hypothetical protein
MIQMDGNLFPILLSYGNYKANMKMFFAQTTSGTFITINNTPIVAVQITLFQKIHLILKAQLLIQMQIPILEGLDTGVQPETSNGYLWTKF